MHVTMRSLATVMLVLAAAGCSAQAGEDEEGVGAEEGELRGSFEAGTKLVTTANVNLRRGPSLNDEVLQVLRRGTVVELVDPEPQDQFYRVKLASGQEGYCYGAYLDKADGDSDGAPGASSPDGPFPTRGVFKPRGTGYYPANTTMQGGFNDMKGARLRTLQQYLRGEAEYVSVAMDTGVFRYGQKLRIKELELRYQRVIEFRVVDTGGRFYGRGKEKIDICTASKRDSEDRTINQVLTVAPVN